MTATLMKLLDLVHPVVESPRAVVRGVLLGWGVVCDGTSARDAELSQVTSGQGGVNDF